MGQDTPRSGATPLPTDEFVRHVVAPFRPGGPATAGHPGLRSAHDRAGRRRSDARSSATRLKRNRAVRLAKPGRLPSGVCPAAGGDQAARFRVCGIVLGETRADRAAGSGSCRILLGETKQAGGGPPPHRGGGGGGRSRQQRLGFTTRAPTAVRRRPPPRSTVSAAGLLPRLAQPRSTPIATTTSRSRPRAQRGVTRVEEATPRDRRRARALRSVVGGPADEAPAARSRGARTAG